MIVTQTHSIQYKLDSDDLLRLLTTNAYIDPAEYVEFKLRVADDSVVVTFFHNGEFEA